VSQEFSSQISGPSLSVGSDRDLHIDSTLNELPMYSFQVENTCTGREIIKYLEQYPQLPGIILLEQGKHWGMISRKQLLELAIRPHGHKMLLKESLSVLYSYLRKPILYLSEQTTILSAMQSSLTRSPDLLAEPIVVQSADNHYQLLDQQELNIAAWQIRSIETQLKYERSQAKMIQNDKMASLGRLVDGVVHEILDPVGFIWGNLTYVTKYSQDLLKLIAVYEQQLSQINQEIIACKEDIEFDFLEQDLIQTLNSIRTGAERLKKLVSSLQNFCHIDEVHPKPADIHACLDSIVLLINSRIKGEIEIARNYGHLPPVFCFMGQLNQVFMNILSQAVDVLLNSSWQRKLYPESTNTKPKPRINITTSVISQPATQPNTPDSRWVAIRIADNGPGMSPELKKQITETFSKEKNADKETSLAVSYRIITVRHGGKLSFHSELNVGTEFEILLPLV
jgi:signal transduction histidine kinase